MTVSLWEIMSIILIFLHSFLHLPSFSYWKRESIGILVLQFDSKKSEMSGRSLKSKVDFMLFVDSREGNQSLLCTHPSFFVLIHWLTTLFPTQPWSTLLNIVSFNLSHRVPHILYVTYITMFLSCYCFCPDAHVHCLKWAVTAAAIGYGIYVTIKLRNKHVNPCVKKDCPKVVDVVEIEDIGNEKAFCRCWRSAQFPYCDGSHGKHNSDTGDNVGPLVIKKRGAK